jgi:hypothetical protein
MAAEASLGPVQYIVVGFPGNKFKGEILPALGDLVQKGLVRVMDLAFAAKDADGTVVCMEFEDLVKEESSPFAAFENMIGDLISENDLLLAADELEPGSSAAVLVWENLWAKPFAEALQNADGALVAYDRIPYEVIQAVIKAVPPKE